LDGDATLAGTWAHVGRRKRNLNGVFFTMRCKSTGPAMPASVTMAEIASTPTHGTTLTDTLRVAAMNRKKAR
jgi:hypothetical protein